MSTNFDEVLQDFLERALPKDISFEITTDNEERFYIELHKESHFQDVKFQITGTEARVLCLLNLDTLEDSIKNRVLSMLAYESCNVIGKYADKYTFTLWSGERDFSKIPALKKLQEKEGLILELSSKPCLISTAELAFNEIIEIFCVFNLWLDSDVLEHTTEDENVDAKKEGSAYEITATRYERSKINRDICLKFHGFSCNICGVNLEDLYGERAKGFIHVHHLEKLADSVEKVIDPINDLIPVCPNCHNIIHLTKQPAEPDEIRKLIEENKEN